MISNLIQKSIALGIANVCSSSKEEIRFLRGQCFARLRPSPDSFFNFFHATFLSGPRLMLT
jgi:hypothetical protein